MRYVATYRMKRNAIKYLLEDTKGREYVGNLQQKGHTEKM